MAVPYTFGSATNSIPLSQLDSNFATAITIGNTAVQLGNTVTTLNNMTLANVTISSGTSNIQTNVANATGVLIEANGGTGTTTGYYGFKNRIINGGMGVDQRNAGAAQTITAGAALAYTVDRWYAWTTGANGTTQQVAGTAPSQYALKFTGATSNTLCGIAQRIEQLNSYDLASGAVTISAYMTASTNTTITAILNGPSTTADTFGTIASPTVTQIATTTFSVTTTRTLFTWTISSATMSGFNKGLELIFKAASGLGNAVTWTVEQVQLEKGSTATSFDYRSYGTELALCQRYFFKTFPQGTAVAQNAGLTGAIPSWAGGSAYNAIVDFPVIMRAGPTVVAYNPSAANSNFNTGETSTVSTVTTDRELYVYSSAPAGTFAYIHATASSEL